MGVSAIPTQRPLLIFHPTDTPPPGYIKANAPLLSRTAHAWLFSQIGTLYGAGDGVATFVGGPDMRGEFPRGWDDGRGIDPGRGIGTAQLDAMQGHKHMVQESASSSGGAATNYRASGSFSGPTGGPVTDGVNGTPRTAAETRSRNVACLFCIAIAP